MNYPIVILREPGDLRCTNWDDTIHIFYSQEYVVYQMTAARQLSDDSKIAQTERYFVYRKGDDSGHVFTTAMRDSATVMVDSLLKYYGFAHADFALGPVDSLHEKQEVAGVTIEKYFYKHKIEGFPYDSSYYYFARGLDTDYSIARAQDSLHRAEGKKVFKVKLINNEKYNDQVKMVVPRQELYIEIHPTTARDPKKIHNLVAAYKKTVKR